MTATFGQLSISAVKDLKLFARQNKSQRSAASSGHDRYSMMEENTTTGETFIINELLCCVQNNFASSISSGLQTTVSGFYTADEITVAKSKLYEVVKRVYTSRDDLHIDDLPRFTTRRPGDNKRRLDTGDIIDYYTTLDTTLTTNDLPRFVALDLTRIPPFNLMLPTFVHWQRMLNFYMAK